MNPFELHKLLFSHYGLQHWWPVTERGQTKPSYKPRKKFTEQQIFEIAIGGILTQNTNWRNVMKAIENINSAGAMSPEKINSMKLEKLRKLIRPAGYFNQKSTYLKNFTKYIVKKYNNGINEFFSLPIQELRRELLSITGIGNETADSIILYAAQKPIFMVDAYTHRLLERFYGMPKMNYSGVQKFFHGQLPEDTQLFNEFHALIVKHCQEFCRKKPLCERCFLKQKCKNLN